MSSQKGNEVTPGGSSLDVPSVPQKGTANPGSPADHLSGLSFATSCQAVTLRRNHLQWSASWLRLYRCSAAWLGLGSLLSLSWLKNQTAWSLQIQMCMPCLHSPPALGRGFGG